MLEKSFALFQEHMNLGAEFETNDFDITTTKAYSGVDEMAYKQALAEGALIADATGALLGLVTGEGASRFMQMSFASKLLNYTECSYSATFMPEGTLAGIPYTMRTGTNEYLIFDPSLKASAVYTYLQTLVQIMTDTSRTGAIQVEFSEVDELAVPLLVYGKKAETLLSDYLTKGEKLPVKGHVAAFNFDEHLPITLAHLTSQTDAYLLIVPKTLVQVLWRSFMSFQYVMPAGFTQAKKDLFEPLLWWSYLDQADAVTLKKKEISSWGLLRKSNPNTPYLGEANLR